MGARGPKAEPLVFKRRPGATAAPVPPPDFDLSQPPELTFDDVAVAEWHRVAPGLVASGQVTTTDRAALISYCRSYSRWLKAEHAAAGVPFVVENRSGNLAPHPIHAILDRVQARLQFDAAALGLTPASRGRVRTAPATPAAAEPVGKWGGLLK